MKVKIGKYPKHYFWHGWLYSLFGYSPKQRVKIKIDTQDTWSMDHTLAYIIHPMLIQLKETTHGYPNGLTEERWNETLDEIIWAFEQKIDFNWEDQFYGPYIEGNDGTFMNGHFEWIDREGLKAHQLRMTAGFKLFGIYYENLWD